MPDPTILTTEQLLREVEGAVKLLDAKQLGLTEVVKEKFASVVTQFALIERQRVEQKADTEKAVQAALSAAKEAVKEQTAASDKSITKSETAMTEQLKQLNATFTTAIKAVADSLDDVKSRQDRSESGKQAVAESRVDQRLNMGAVVGIIGAVVGALSLVALIVFAIANHV